MLKNEQGNTDAGTKGILKGDLFPNDGLILWWKGGRRCSSHVFLLVFIYSYIFFFLHNAADNHDVLLTLGGSTL